MNLNYDVEISKKDGYKRMNWFGLLDEFQNSDCDMAMIVFDEEPKNYHVTAGSIRRSVKHFGALVNVKVRGKKIYLEKVHPIENIKA